MAVYEKDFKACCVVKDQMTGEYKDVETKEAAKKLKEIIEYVSENVEELIRRIWVKQGLYEAICHFARGKEEISFSLTMHELCIDALTYFAEENIVSIVLSTSGFESFLFGHYVAADFDEEWNVVYWEVC